MEKKKMTVGELLSRLEQIVGYKEVQFDPDLAGRLQETPLAPTAFRTCKRNHASLALTVGDNPVWYKKSKFGGSCPSVVELKDELRNIIDGKKFQSYRGDAEYSFNANSTINVTMAEGKSRDFDTELFITGIQEFKDDVYLLVGEFPVE